MWQFSASSASAMMISSLRRSGLLSSFSATEATNEAMPRRSSSARRMPLAESAKLSAILSRLADALLMQYVGSSASSVGKPSAATSTAWRSP